MEKAQSTTGFPQVTVEYAHRALNGHSLVSEWWNGSQWSTIATHSQDGFHEESYRLPGAAGDNPAFKLRFRGLIKGSKIRSHVDEVRIVGN
jgi:hypothetical protein